MQKAFLLNVQKEKLFNFSDKILLTVSGGIDSVVMCELFHRNKLNFGIAHCNFQLRANESDSDALFVEELSSKYNVPFHSIVFDTTAFAKKNKLSIQVAARQLRYEWFEKIREEFKYHYIATAHHRDDSIETFFINLIRGTGISGLHGILAKQGNIIRPMLFTGKEEIEAFAKKNKINHREDSSNASNKYVRNKIRHHVIPVLKEINPKLENAINTDIRHLQNVELIYKNEIERQRSLIVKTKKNSIVISIELLKELNPHEVYLYEFLKPYDFNSATVDNIVEMLDGESGKQFFSSTHRLIKDRELLILEKVTETGKAANESFKITIDQAEFITNDFQLKLSKGLNQKDFIVNRSSLFACLDFEKLEFPLIVRRWRQGDAFYPLGMKGKKKLSDFFIDKKLSISQKENTWLLISKSRIAWVIGQRIDDRFKVTEKTKKNYFAELVK